MLFPHKVVQKRPFSALSKGEILKAGIRHFSLISAGTLTPIHKLTFGPQKRKRVYLPDVLGEYAVATHSGRVYREIGTMLRIGAFAGNRCNF